MNYKRADARLGAAPQTAAPKADPQSSSEFRIVCVQLKKKAHIHLIHIICVCMALHGFSFPYTCTGNVNIN